MSKLDIFDVTATGASHIKIGKVCQDFALSSGGNDYALAIVCDGHGGDKYFRSDRGSRIAATKAKEAIREFMKSRFKKSHGGKLVNTILTNPDAFMHQLTANIIFRWREAIAEDFKHEPFTDAEKAILSPNEMAELLKDEEWVSTYGTTLIAVIRSKEFWFGLHIGDGKCVTVSNANEYAQPIPWDEKCFLNKTTSLCDEQALTHFRYYFDKVNLPKAIFVASDGVDDTFGSDEALHRFYKTVLQLFSEKGMKEGVTELRTYLPQMSEKGSRDDISIAGILVRKDLHENGTLE